MAKLEITNMVMVQDPVSGQVVVEDRVKSWCGIAFPGGHTEDGESIYDSAVREVREETGLEVRNLKPCGFMYWFHKQTHDRYFTYFFKTTDFSGTLLDATDEGRVFWAEPDALPKMKTAPNFREYLPMFLENKYAEAFCAWDDSEQSAPGKSATYHIEYR